MRMAASDYSFTLVIYLFSAILKPCMVKKMFIGIGLCNPMMCVLKGMSKSLKYT